MKPRRILFIIRSYPPDQVGGGAKSVQTLAEGLSNRGHQVHVLRLAPAGEEEAYRRRAVEAGVAGPGKPDLHITPLRNIYWPYGKEQHSKIAKLVWHTVDLHNARAARDLRSLLREIRPEIVNTSIIDGFSPAIMHAISHSGAKLIHTMRDYYLICSRSSMFRDGRNCDTLCRSCKGVRKLNRQHLRNVDLFLSNSAYVAAVHKRTGVLPADSRCAIQWNVNERPIAAAPRQIDPDKLTFGFIGRIAPTKGVDRLIEAAAKLPEEGREWSLVIAGDGSRDYVETVRRLSETIKNITFLGWTTPEELYGQVDVLICPSVYNEPLPRVIYEGYGFGLPVIASRLGGHPEIVKEGVSGELYPGDDASGLAEHMQLFREMSGRQYTSYSANALLAGQAFTSAAVLDSFEEHMASLFVDHADRTNGSNT